MANGARNCMRYTLAMKCIIMGLLKIVCLYKGLTLSHWHSGFTFFSLLLEIISALLVCFIDDTSSRKQKHDEMVSAAGMNTFGCMTFLKFLATLNTYHKELEEIKKMCYLCTIMEIILIALMLCCYCCCYCCCIDEPKQKPFTIKQTA